MLEEKHHYNCTHILLNITISHFMGKQIMHIVCVEKSQQVSADWQPASKT